MEIAVALRLTNSGDMVVRYLESYRAWCETRLECPLTEAIILHTRANLAEIVMPKLLEGVPLDQGVTYEGDEDEDTPDGLPPGAAVRFLPAIMARWSDAGPVTSPEKLLNRLCHWEVGPGLIPRFELQPSRRRTLPTSANEGWVARWKEGPLALWFDGLPRPLVAVEIPVTSVVHGMTAETVEDCILVNRADVKDALELLRLLFSETRRILRVLGGMNVALSNPALNWTDLVLSQEIVETVKEDFEQFLGREAWYRRYRVPYRRGYLFYGPPGNGKTSVVRIMAGYPGIAAYGIDFSNDELSNRWLTHLMLEAARSAPSLIVLEDLDRLYGPRNQEFRDNRSGITMQHLLNCLDGVGMRDGVIFVATANDIRGLDRAVLERPGRFDAIIDFPNPDEALRARFFGALPALLKTENVEEAARLTQGLSFAHLREVHIVAAQRAFRRKDDSITWADVRDAIARVKLVLHGARSRAGSRGLGFEASAVREQSAAEGAGERRSSKR